MTNYSELIAQAIEELKNNDELFVDMVNELDSWNGFADGFRCYPMCELDDLFSGCSLADFLDKLGENFNVRDEYMVDTIYGLESTDYPEDIYRDNVDEGELLDNIIEHVDDIYFNDNDFEELVRNIIEAKEVA